MLYFLYRNKTERSDYMGFSKRLKELQVKNEMNQKQLANFVDLKPSTISKYKNVYIGVLDLYRRRETQ